MYILHGLRVYILHGLRVYILHGLRVYILHGPVIPVSTPQSHYGIIFFTKCFMIQWDKAIARPQ